MQLGCSSERLTRRIEQLELWLEELEGGEAEAISKAAAEDQPIPAREGTWPKRKPLPDHLPARMSYTNRSTTAAALVPRAVVTSPGLVKSPPR